MKLSGAAQRQLTLEAAGHGLCGHQEPDSGLRLSDWPAAGREHTTSFLPVICSPVMWGSNCCHFIKLLLGLDELMQQAWQLTQEKGATLFYFWIPLPSTHFLYVKLSQGVISQGQGHVVRLTPLPQVTMQASADPLSLICRSGRGDHWLSHQKRWHICFMAHVFPLIWSKHFYHSNERRLSWEC